MSAHWLFADFPRSRFAIETELRQTFWKAGWGKVWFTCLQDTPPFECAGSWNDTAFAIEWQPKTYLRLKMPAPNQTLLDAFERVLKHSALAAYKQNDGSVVIEWWINNPDARYRELQSSGVHSLERLDR